MTLSSIETIMQALGWTLLHSIWQIGLIAILFFLLISFIPQAKPEIRYGLGVLGLILTAIISTGTFYHMYESMNEALPLSVQPAQKEAVLWHFYEPATFDQEAAQLDSDWHSFLIAAQYWMDQRIDWLVGFWLCGILLLSLRFGGSLFYLERLKQREVQPLPAYWQKKMEEMQALLLIRRPIRLLASGIASAPLMFGYLKPVILLPASMLSGLSNEQLEAIIAHEMAHICRNDYWVNLLQSVLEIIFFFHPALWWISSVVKAEREKCCDDLAVSLCGNSLAYAKALACIEEFKLEKPAFALAFGGSKGSLLHRIERILQPGKRSLNLKARFVSVSLVVFSLLLFLSAGESRAFHYGSEKAKEMANWVTTSYLSHKIKNQNILKSDQPFKINSEKKQAENTNKTTIQDTLPTQSTIARAKSYSFQLQDSILNPQVLQMDSLSDFIIDGFTDSSFVVNVKAARAPASPGALGLSPVDNSLQMMVDNAIIRADSMMQKQVHFTHLFLPLATSFQDSTLEARLQELEMKMRAKEREMEILMLERAAELQQKEQAMVRRIQQLERALQQKMIAQERELTKKMQQQEQVRREETAKIEAESARMEESILTLEVLLLADELIEKGKRYKLNISQSQIMLNGKAINSRLFKKYKRIMQQAGIFDFEENENINITRTAN